MRVRFDVESDSAYVYFREIGRGEAADQISIEDPAARGWITLDLDRDGRLIGIEVLNARAGLPAELLDRAEEI